VYLGALKLKNLIKDTTKEWVLETKKSYLVVPYELCLPNNILFLA
jgi:hypothetical protein